MGFSSYLCSVDKSSIPAWPYAGRDIEESEVVLVLPDDTTINGIYDGYQRINNDGDMEELSNVIPAAMIKRMRYTKEQADDYYNFCKIVKKRNYTGQKYADLEYAKNCPMQGYFYEKEYDVTQPHDVNETQSNLAFLAQNKEALEKMNNGSEV